MKRRMKLQGLLLMTAMMLASCHTQRTIFMAGDSTTEYATQEKKGYIRGWAQMLPQYLNDDVKMDIRARGGRSPRRLSLIPGKTILFTPDAHGMLSKRIAVCK